MKALVAIDSFKGALSSLDAGSAAAKGIARACSAQVQVCAVADGGEGSVDALAAHKQGHFQPFACLNAFHQPIAVFSGRYDHDRCRTGHAAGAGCNPL